MDNSQDTYMNMHIYRALIMTVAIWIRYVMKCIFGVCIHFLVSLLNVPFWVHTAEWFLTPYIKL